MTEQRNVVPNGFDSLRDSELMKLREVFKRMKNGASVKGTARPFVVAIACVNEIDDRLVERGLFDAATGKVTDKGIKALMEET
jgi:hypothetical protein